LPRTQDFISTNFPTRPEGSEFLSDTQLFPTKPFQGREKKRVIMSGYRGVNVSQYLRNLNVQEPLEEESFVNEDDLALFTNTQFFDYETGQNTDYQAAPVKPDAAPLTVTTDDSAPADPLLATDFSASLEFGEHSFHFHYSLFGWRPFGVCIFPSIPRPLPQIFGVTMGVQSQAVIGRSYRYGARGKCLFDGEQQHGHSSEHSTNSEPCKLRALGVPTGEQILSRPLPLPITGNVPCLSPHS